MKIHRASSSRKKVALAISGACLLGIIITATLEIAGVTDFIEVNRNPQSGPTQSEEKAWNKTNLESKEDFIKSPDPTERTIPTPVSSDVELSARQESDGSVTVLTKLRNIPTGSCTISIENGTATYSDTAEIIYQTNFSSCAGFTIDKNKLGGGEWSIKLSINADTTLEKNITFKVH